MEGQRRDIDGFTILELLIVLGIIGILSAVAVFGYQRYMRQAYTSEVYSMVAAIKAAEDNYKAETGQYLSTGTDEEDFYPALNSAGVEPKKKTIDLNSKTEWRNLGISPPSNHLYCGYVAIAGPANDLSNAGARGVTLFGANTPKVAWYYIRATCDLDGNSAKNSFYETTHDRQTVYIGNEGY
jgi:prepilin-type N-terminal cleavage/methylation domain-containing protein